MALNATQIGRAAEEFRAHLSTSRLTEVEAARDLSWDFCRLQRTLDLTQGADPVDAWELRDYLYHAVVDAGYRPAFSVLTTRARLRARMWFTLRRAPRRRGAALSP